MHIYKVHDATRPKLFWICRIINHTFRWRLTEELFSKSWIGDCLICGACRRMEVVWPQHPSTVEYVNRRGMWIS